MDVARSEPRGSLPCGRYLLAPLTGNKEEDNSTPSKACIDSIPDQQSLYPGGQHTIAFYARCVPGLQDKEILSDLAGVFIVTLDYSVGQIT